MEILFAGLPADAQTCVRGSSREMLGPFRSARDGLARLRGGWLLLDFRRGNLARSALVDILHFGIREMVRTDLLRFTGR
jgi:hypothetical protein